MGFSRDTDMHSDTADVSADTDLYKVLWAVISIQQAAVFYEQRPNLYNYLQMKSILAL